MEDGETARSSRHPREVRERAVAPVTWMADAGVPIRHLRKIADHGSLSTTQWYLHLDRHSVSNAVALLSKHLAGSTNGPQVTSTPA